MLSLPLLITNLMLTPRLAIASDITLSNGVIFKAKKTRGFTGPEWVLMSGITFEQTDGVAAEFKDWLEKYNAWWCQAEWNSEIPFHGNRSCSCQSIGCTRVFVDHNPQLQRTQSHNLSTETIEKTTRCYGWRGNSTELAFWNGYHGWVGQSEKNHLTVVNGIYC